ncbi:response regulator [Photobacterium kishitanii]|uniref:Response regulator n=1 Tax=Photobacterium kishitanii TaxID=318456 RepID=A0A2T3K9W5_9GAMM|nr:response regulator [Photobacterium kishitanii]PSU87348.1 response regulator [Photobacterium kishitanii]
MTEEFTKAPLHNPHDIRVLIIDDQPSSGALIKNILDSINITTVDIATDSDSAFQLCKNTRYDLMIIDFHLEPNLNGSELLAAIRKRNHISSHCGVVFISGDRTPEVIVTSMSIHADSFLTKPLNIGKLKKRVIAIYQACLLRQPIYTALDNHQTSHAIELCRQLLLYKGHNLEIEILLIDLLIEQQDWQQATQLLTTFSQHTNNHKLILRQARLKHRLDETQAAIHCLHSLIKQVPLYVEAYDELASLLQQQHRYNDAKIIAQQAMVLTPGICHRSLLVAQLATDANDLSLFFEAGKVLATHLPIIGNDWIASFAEFTAIFEQLVSQQLSLPQKLLISLKTIQQHAKRRLTYKQQATLADFSHITLARFAFSTQQPLKAKRRLLHGLARYYGKMSQAPTAIMIDALPLLIHFGETRLIGEIYQALMSGDLLDDYSYRRLAQLGGNKFLIANIRLLISQLVTAKSMLNHDPHRAYCIYQTILRDYPYCTEAHLGRITCLLPQPQFTDNHINDSLYLIKKMPLPPPLSGWFTQLQQQIKDEKTIINV